MHVSALALLRSLRSELSEHFSEELSEASIGQSAISAVRLLEVREKGGSGFLTRRLNAAAEVINKLSAMPALSANPLVARLKTEAQEAKRNTI